VLASLTGPRWLVLGDMGEVGNQGPAFHREVGAYAREHGIERMWTAGNLSRDAADAYGASTTAARATSTAWPTCWRPCGCTRPPAPRCW
jgi:UDP-N-acetylmuramoyl-tripeptide--D-alanyl-D-alanine ligase